MRIRFALILASIVSLAVAPATFADHHKGSNHKGSNHKGSNHKGSKAKGKSYEAKGKSYENSMGNADKKAREARDRGAQQRDTADRGAKRTRERAEAAVDKADPGRGAEMRARRDERKAIMEDAKSSAEPGTPRKGKKPWYRFWESDEEVTPESGPKSE